MPVFQPIVNSQPTPVGARRPVAPAVDTQGISALEAGIGGLLQVGAAGLKGYLSAQGGEDKPTEGEIRRQGLTELDRLAKQAAKVRAQDPRKADDLMRQGILKVNTTFGLSTSDEGAVDILNRYSFDSMAGVAQGFRQEQALRDSPEYARAALALSAGGDLTPEELDAAATIQARERIALQEGIANGSLGAQYKVIEFQGRVADYTAGIQGVLKAFEASDTVPPQELFDRMDAIVQQARVEGIQVMQGADPAVRSNLEASVSAMSNIASTVKDKYTVEALRNKDIQGWLRALDGAKGSMTAEQYQTVKTTFLNMDPSSWAALVTNTEEFLDLQGGLTALRLFKPEAFEDTVNDPKVPKPIAAGKSEVMDGDTSAATGIAEIHSRLLKGDPKSVVNPERRAFAARSLSAVANYIGKAVDNGNYLTPEVIERTFSKESVSYFNEIVKNDPELAVAVRGQFIENISKYRAVVDAQLSVLEEVGLTVEGDTVQFDFGKVLAASGLENTDELTVLLEEAIERYYPSGDIFVDGGNRLHRWALDNPGLTSKQRAMVGDATRALTTSKAMSEAKDFQTMLTSRNLLEERYSGFKQEVLKIPPVSEQEVGRFSALLPLIDKHESTGSYDKLWGSAELKHPDFKNVRVSELTVDQAIAFSNPSGKYGQHVKATNSGVLSTPMGRYQIVGTTLKDVKKHLGLTGQEVFNEDMQDRMFVYLGKRRLKAGTTTAQKISQLRAEWAGLKNASDEELEGIVQVLDNS